MFSSVIALLSGQLKLHTRSECTALSGKLTLAPDAVEGAFFVRSVRG
jgi:hypothetical protein